MESQEDALTLKIVHYRTKLIHRKTILHLMNKVFQSLFPRKKRCDFKRLAVPETILAPESRNVVPILRSPNHRVLPVPD
jgi:hypothetical protein